MSEKKQYLIASSTNEWYTPPVYIDAVRAVLGSIQFDPFSCCERLQGFPDDYTLILYKDKDASDAVRYHALGNSWAVPVVRWIGRRIMEVLPCN